MDGMLTPTIPCISFISVGVGVLLAYLALGRTRGYLFYLALAFIGLGASLLFRPPFIYAPVLLTIMLFLMAIREGIRDTKARLHLLQAEQRAREEAFAEEQAELARKGL